MIPDSCFGEGVRQGGGAEQREVGRVRDHARVQERVVGQLTTRAATCPGRGRAPCRGAPSAGPGCRRPDGSRARPTTCGAPWRSSGCGSSSGKRSSLASSSGPGHVGHPVGVRRRRARRMWNDAARLKIACPCWMATTRRVVKLRPSRMRSTSYTIGTLRVAEAQEVGVHRVHAAVGVDGAAGGHQRLREHLAAVDARRAPDRGSCPGTG